jgi:hypothetical protein
LKKFITLNYIKTFSEMNIVNKKTEDLTPKIMQALDRAVKRIKLEAKATNTYIVVSDGKGGTKKIYAKDL